jgi:hypothetical protein
MSSRVTPELGPRQIPELTFASSLVRACLRACLPNWVLDRFPNWPSLLHWFVHVFARAFRTGFSTDSRIGRPPKFAPPPARGSGPPHVRDPLLHRIKIPELHTFANSRLHRFQSSENREFPAPEKHVSRILSNLTFRG